MTDPIINDLTIQAATVNGSGSQTANLVLTRAIFKMGIPVAPKNVFPSNIEGLPTWYQLRVTPEGYMARSDRVDILVAFNAATWRDDLGTVRPGGVVIHEESYSTADARTDVTYYAVPFSKLAKSKIPNETLRKQLANMIYVGVVAGVLGIPWEAIEHGVKRQFLSKPKAVQVNLDAVKVGLDYWQDNFSKQDPYRLEPMTGVVEGKVLVEIFDIQRIGPSTGLPTRTSQGDISFAYTISHGDTKHLVLLPGTVEECYEFGRDAFDYADRFQTAVFVLSDLDLGMNLWMTPSFSYPDKPFDRGKVLSKADLDKLGGEWGRYQDVDGDGITYRTLPGTDHPSAGYFTRGSGHDEHARYTERADAYARNMDRLSKKFETARKALPAPVTDESARSAIGLIAFGSTNAAVVEARQTPVAA